MPLPKSISNNLTTIIVAVVTLVGGGSAAIFGPDAMDVVQKKQVAQLEHLAFATKHDKDMTNVRRDVGIQLVDFRLDYLNDKILRLKGSPSLTISQQRDLDMAEAEYPHQQNRKQHLLDSRQL